MISGRRAAEIAASIERRIHTRALAPGECLPTVRSLADSLHVSPVTVAAAYRQLQARGLVVGEGRRGTRVRSLRSAPDAPLVSAAAFADVVDLASGNPDPALLPPLESALRTAGSVARLYTDDLVLDSLANFAAAEFEADGIAATALTVTSGALDAIERLLAEHLRAGDRVAVEDPASPALLDLLAAAGYLPHPLVLDPEGPQPESVAAALQRGVRAIVMTPRAHNPTGSAFSERRADDLRAVLSGRDILVIENDPAGPVAGVPAFTVSGATSHWAVVRSVSKYLGPDLRLAIVAGDELSIARVTRRLALGPRWVSHLLQYVVLTVWSDPATGRGLARAADVYAQRRAALAVALSEQGIHVAAPSGINVWIPVRAEAEAVQSLISRGWAVAAGERYRLRAAPGIRVTTSALDAAAAPRFAADCAAAVRGPRMPSA